MIAALVCSPAAAWLVAATVEVSFGLQFVDIVHVRWRPLATAALGNAAVILGLSTAIESLYWIWRELSLKGAVLDWVPSRR